MDQEDHKGDSLTAYVGWRKQIAALNALNPLPYRCLTEDKILFNMYCEAAGLPTPEIYGILDKTGSPAPHLKVFKGVAELERELQTAGISQVVLKPVNGTKGQGVLILDYSVKGGFSDDRGDIVSREKLASLLEYKYRGVVEHRFLAQRRILPHSSTSHLSPNCPLSYRVITLLDRQGIPSIVSMFAKLATEGKYFDNIAQGGLILGCDDMGKVVFVKHKPEGGRLERKSEFLSKFRSWELPYYSEVCKLALSAAAKFNCLRCVGWDIAVGEDGLWVYEGNNPWGPICQAASEQGLWKGKFLEEAESAMKSGPYRPPWW